MKPVQPTGRRRWLPHPVLSALLALSWLLLQSRVAPADVLVAGILAWGMPLLLHRFLPAGARLRRLDVAAHLVGIVLWDIVASNLAVARIVLTPNSDPQPAWVPIELDLEEPMAIALLATIITTTPGTVSCIVDETRRRILVHALDCSDPAAMAADIKQRYERPLKEMLG